MRAIEARPILERAVCLVLEMMCFSATEPCLKNFSANNVIGTTVDFGGSLSGCLQLETTGAAAQWLTAAFLGLAADDVACDVTTVSDTVCELGNIICGRFLSLLDPCANVNIHPPIKRFAVSHSAGISWNNFQSDGGPLRVAFQLN